MIGIGTCDNGKVQYADYKSAKKQIVSMRKDYIKREYSVYKCQICRLFHIATANKNLKKSIKESKKLNKYPIKVDSKNRKFSPIIKAKKFTENASQQTSYKLISNTTAAFLKRLISNNS